MLSTQPFVTHDAHRPRCGFMPSVYKQHDNVEDNNVCIGTEIFGRAMSAGAASSVYGRPARGRSLLSALGGQAR
jgi:hypothetical protein